MRQSLHSLYFNHSCGSKSCNAINYFNKSFLKSLTRLVMYQIQNIENAVSMHKMGFGTSCLAYIMRGLYDILLENNSNYIFFIHYFIYFIYYILYSIVFTFPLNVSYYLYP